MPEDYRNAYAIIIKENTLLISRENETWSLPRIEQKECLVTKVTGEGSEITLRITPASSLPFHTTSEKEALLMQPVPEPMPISPRGYTQTELEKMPLDQFTKETFKKLRANLFMS
ncbi:MAG: hypothetical protein AABX66_00075 [Nanoarchaeota archaeon]